MAVQEANVLGAEQAEKELLRERALKLELEQQKSKVEEEKNKLKEEQKSVDRKQVENKRTTPTSQTSSSASGGKECDGEYMHLTGRTSSPILSSQ